jgi:hypothetical protein
MDVQSLTLILPYPWVMSVKRDAEQKQFEISLWRDFNMEHVFTNLIQEKIRNNTFALQMYDSSEIFAKRSYC